MHRYPSWADSTVYAYRWEWYTSSQVLEHAMVTICATQLFSLYKILQQHGNYHCNSSVTFILQVIYCDNCKLMYISVNNLYIQIFFLISAISIIKCGELQHSKGIIRISKLQSVSFCILKFWGENVFNFSGYLKLYIMLLYFVFLDKHLA